MGYVPATLNLLYNILYSALMAKFCAHANIYSIHCIRAHGEMNAFVKICRYAVVIVVVAD